MHPDRPRELRRTGLRPRHRRVVRAVAEALFAPARGVYVADGSVLPTSIGVNSQLPIMAIARRIAHCIADAWPPPS